MAEMGPNDGPQLPKGRQDCNTGETDLTKSNTGWLWNVAAIAIAGINTAAAIKMADLQYDIAKQYLDIAKWWRTYYNNTFKPWEDVELADAWALEEEKPHYDITIGRHRTFGRLRFRGVAEKSMQCTSGYCTGLRAALLKDVMSSEAGALAALSNLGYRNERAYIEARNEVRWQRRLSVTHRGRNMIANNINYSNLAAGIFGDLGQQAGGAAGGAIRFLGYNLNRNETPYPTMMRGMAQVAQPGNSRTPSAVDIQRTSHQQDSAGGYPVITSGVIKYSPQDPGRVATEAEMARYGG